MYTVSNDYTKQMNKGLRNESYVRVTFGVIDPDAPNYSTITDSGHLHYSNSGSLDLGFSVNRTYQTLERNRFILDGKNPLPIRDNTLYQGYVGDEISDDNGNYTTPPQLNINFSNYVEFGGFTIKFDVSTGQYPSDFTFIAKKDGIEVFNRIEYPTSTTHIISDAIPVCNEIIITYGNSKIPHRRARISEIIYGVVDILTDADITGFSFKTTMSLISSSLPNYEFSFDIFDINGKYDPEKPDNLFEYLEAGQPVKCELGQMLDNGEIEYIPICNCFTQGEVSVSNAGFVRTISLSSGSILDFWDLSFTEDTYTPSGQTYYDLVNKVINSIGYNGTVAIDDKLNAYTTSIPLGNRSVKECLQLIANACCAGIYVDRNGIVTIKKYINNPTEFNMSFGKMYETPKGNRTPRIRSIITSYSECSLEDSSTIGVVKVNSNEFKEYSLVYETATNITYQNNGLTLNGTPKIYTNKIVFTAKGTGSLTVTGKKITINTINYVKNYNEIGEDLIINNELIDTPEKAEQFCDAIADFYARRTDYEFSHRGYPQLDLLDDVTIQTNYTGNVDSTIYESSLDYNGVISGTFKVLTKLKE